MEEKMKKEEEKNENTTVSENKEVKTEKEIKKEEKTKKAEAKDTNKNQKTKKEKSKKEPNKKSKKWIIWLIIAIIVVVVAVGGFIAFHMGQLGQLTSEMVNLSKIDTSNIENINIDMDIKTKGGYAVIEETMKQYINDLYAVVQEGETLIDTKELQKIGSIENIKEDGPDFLKTKAKIEETKEKVKKYVEDLKQKADINNMISAIDNKKVGNYYKELYKELIRQNSSNVDLSSAVEELENAEKLVMKRLDKVGEIINFLSENKASWQIQNDKLLFKDMTKLTQYNRLVLGLY